MATVGDPEYIKECKALFICGTPLASTKGMDGLLTSNAKKAQELLKEAGYDGTPVVLMHSTDLKMLTNLAPVAKSLMEKARASRSTCSRWIGRPWLRAAPSKDPPDAGGWNAFLTAWVAADVMNPVSTAYLNASCDKALFGWPCDAELEKLRDDFARETDPAKQKAIAEAVQLRGIEATPRDSGRRDMCSRSPCARTSRASSSRRRRCSGTSKSPSELSGAGGGTFSARRPFARSG